MCTNGALHACITWRTARDTPHNWETGAHRLGEGHGAWGFRTAETVFLLHNTRAVRGTSQILTRKLTELPDSTGTSMVPSPCCSATMIVKHPAVSSTHLQARQHRVAGCVELQHVWLEWLKGHHTQLPEQQAHGTAELTSGSVLGSQLRATLQPLLAGRNTCS